MGGTSRAILTSFCVLSSLRVVSGEDDTTAIIIASTVAGVLLVSGAVLGTIYGLYKCGVLSKKPEKPSPTKKHLDAHKSNGSYPKPHDPRQYPSANGYRTYRNYPPPPLRMPVHPGPPMMAHPYATYSGPPPEFQRRAAHVNAGTMSGPPPIALVPTPHGTVALRPDPRPVIETRSKKRHHPREPGNRTQGRSRSRSHDRVQEFMVQPSYDGIPVIRPVVYIDDSPKENRRYKKSRSKSRDDMYKTRSREEPPAPAKPQVIEIKLSDLPHAPVYDATDAPPHERRRQTPSPAPAPPPTRPALAVPAARLSPERRSPLPSGMSSETEAVNALRKSVKGVGVTDDSDTSSNAPSFDWTMDHRESRAPDPKAGDVMFFPAGQEVVAERNVEPHIKQKEEVYGYSKVIKSTENKEPTPAVSRASGRPSARFDTDGYEPASSKSMRQSRAGETRYDTEHGRVSGVYAANDIGASMSDRLTALVEDGDKTRFTSYNVGAVKLGDEDSEDDEPIRPRVRRPETPPSDIPIYAQSTRRPSTPPNDIPVSPRESTEIPPLNLYSSMNTPRDPSTSYRPITPPPDFPITPQTSTKRPARPPTPPFDADTNRSEVNDKKPTPAVFGQSMAVDPSTGEPGSFQARQRLIEAHLMKNQGGTSAERTSAAQSNQKSDAVSRPTSNWASPSAQARPANVPVVNVTPGVIPPAPPPPPPALPIR